MRVTVRIQTLVLLVLLAIPLAAEPVRQRPTAAEVELPDQLGGSQSVVELHGEVAVVMVVTASRLRNLKYWQRDLEERFEGVKFVLVADVPRDPPVSYERVAERLAQKVPGEVRVLIDLDGVWATELELDTARPNLLLLDREGALAAQFRGRRQAELLEEVSRRLEALLAE